MGGRRRANDSRAVIMSALISCSVAMVCALVSTMPVAASDTTPPQVSLLLPGGGSFKNGSILDAENAYVTCIAVDDLSNVSTIEYNLDNSTFHDVTSSSDPYVANITLAGLAEGDHHIAVRVVNSAGLATTVEIDFKVQSSQSNQGQDAFAWTVITIAVAFFGVASSAYLLWRRWKKNPPAKIEGPPYPEMPPVL